jgi:hypothetical protein
MILKIQIYRNTELLNELQDLREAIDKFGVKDDRIHKTKFLFKSK